MQKFDKQSGGSFGGNDGQGHERKKDTWLLMFVAGMWFHKPQYNAAAAAKDAKMSDVPYQLSQAQSVVSFEV
ncbi:MAG TPA: hypothetical protein DDW49_02170 [Deltaproteobacteria bacterium]|nr:MAG: hypothetical protein A2048_00770 [Deltaproteobacteria bacterium GWA2_45_12]HBF12190.1 hypothetical protein [Deltaproteobacteria bacterium]